MFRQQRRELRNAEDAVSVGEARAGEDRRREAEPPEHRHRRSNASERVVEGHVHQPAVAGHGLGRADRPVAAGQHSLQLTLERVERDGERILPALRDRVVAQYERS